MVDKILSRLFVKIIPEKKPFTVIREEDSAVVNNQVKNSTLYMRKKTDSAISFDKPIEKRTFRYTSENALMERERACVLILNAYSLR